MSRAIKIFGIGFSADDNDAQIEVAIDGNVIFNGAVTTDKNFDLDAYLAGSQLEEKEVASWIEGDEGSVKKLSIKAISGNFLYKTAASTYIGEEILSDLLLSDLTTLHTYTADDGSEINDPNYNVSIDGQLQETRNSDVSSELEMDGQWDIGIPEGSTMVCDLHIDQGIEKIDESLFDVTL